MHALGNGAEAAEEGRVVHQIPEKPVCVGSKGKGVGHDVMDELEKPLEGLLLVERDVVVHRVRVELGLHALPGDNKLLGAGNRVDDEVGNGIEPTRTAKQGERPIEPIDDGIQKRENHAVVAVRRLGADVEDLDHDLEQAGRRHLLPDPRGHSKLQSQGKERCPPMVEVGHLPVICLSGVILHARDSLADDVEQNAVVNVRVQC